MDFTTKRQLRELVKVANEVDLIDSAEIAQEITRIEKRLFLEIEVCAREYNVGMISVEDERDNEVTGGSLRIEMSMLRDIQGNGGGTRKRICQNLSGSVPVIAVSGRKRERV